MRILIVDDEWSLPRALAAPLIARGHLVSTATGSDEAIDLFNVAGPNGYDLILTDQNMPGPSGYFLGSWVRAAGYTGRLAIMTGDEAEPTNLAKIGAEFWKKPDMLSAPVLIGLVEGTPLVVEG